MIERQSKERAKRDVSSAHALYSPQSTLPWQLQAGRTEPTTAIEKVLHACVCVCARVPVVTKVQDS